MPAKSLFRTIATASILLFGATAAAEAGPPGKWSKVTGVGADDGNTMRPGLARTADGVLHVSWSRDLAGAGSVLHSSVSADAKTVSGPVSIFDNADGVNPSSAVVVAADGTLRAFFAATNVFDGVMASATSANGGAGWTVGGSVSKIGAEGKEVYSAIGIGAATGTDGAFYSIWGDSSPSGGGYHVGLNPNAPDGDLGPAIQTDPKLGVDSSSGQVVSAWNDDGGDVKVMPIAPAGGPVSIPNSSDNGLHPIGITGRIGAPGVFVGYGRGTNPFLSDPSVYRVDTGQATRLTKKDGELISLAAAPGGRLWAFWKVDNAIRATRSNPAATKWGRIVSINPPKQTTAIYNLVGEASTGPLDLLAHVDTSSSTLASWHQRILPGLAFTAKENKKGKLVIQVTDAGAAVPGAKIKVKGKNGSKTTSFIGKVSFALGPGRYKVTSSKSGYASYSKRVRVK